MKPVANRYRNLVTEIERIKASRIVEIGTCKGERAELMLKAAIDIHGNAGVFYHGFDLFETPPADEFSERTPPWPMWRVFGRLAPLGATIRLTAGDSKITVPATGLSDIDLVFIDGGHSEETVKADFANALKIIRRGGSIMLDDHWNYPGGGGCAPLIRTLSRLDFDIDLLEPIDSFAKPYGILKTQMVRVLRK